MKTASDAAYLDGFERLVATQHSKPDFVWRFRCLWHYMAFLRGLICRFFPKQRFTDGLCFGLRMPSPMQTVLSGREGQQLTWLAIPSGRPKSLGRVLRL